MGFAGGGAIEPHACSDRVATGNRRPNRDVQIAEMIENTILAHKANDHTKNVFDPSVRGHTDQFLFRFKKPN